nr:hypothetical protein [Tanacetum cinerariifolium]
MQENTLRGRGQGNVNSTGFDSAGNLGIIKEVCVLIILKDPVSEFSTHCRALEARVAVLETHARRLEWQCQAADDFAVEHIMRTQDLEARARDDTLEDAGKINAKCYRARYREEGDGMQHFEDLDKRKFGFDAIVGMDWLRRHHAMIMCNEKLISATQKDDKPEGKQVKDIPIIQDFPKVFSEKLPDLPPARLIEFQIDQIPRVAPVARAPYRLAPSEMNELSKQTA